LVKEGIAKPIGRPSRKGRLGKAYQGHCASPPSKIVNQGPLVKRFLIGSYPPVAHREVELRGRHQILVGHSSVELRTQDSLPGVEIDFQTGKKAGPPDHRGIHRKSSGFLMKIPNASPS